MELSGRSHDGNFLNFGNDCYLILGTLLGLADVLCADVDVFFLTSADSFGFSGTSLGIGDCGSSATGNDTSIVILNTSGCGSSTAGMMSLSRNGFAFDT